MPTIKRKYNGGGLISWLSGKGWNPHRVSPDSFTRKERTASRAATRTASKKETAATRTARLMNNANRMSRKHENAWTRRSSSKQEDDLELELKLELEKQKQQRIIEIDMRIKNLINEINKYKRIVKRTNATNKVIKGAVKRFKPLHKEYIMLTEELDKLIKKNSNE